MCDDSTESIESNSSLDSIRAPDKLPLYRRRIDVAVNLANDVADSKRDVLHLPPPIVMTSGMSQVKGESTTGPSMRWGQLG